MGGGLKGANDVDGTPLVSLLVLNYQEDPRGRPGNEAECGSATTEKLQRGIRKDLWPKYFPKCPVARHFVYHHEEHVGGHP
jgi:hypothetical protein